MVVKRQTSNLEAVLDWQIIPQSTLEQFDSTELEELELSTRVTNALQRAGISTVGGLLRLPNAGWLKTVENVGEKGALEIKDALGELLPPPSDPDADPGAVSTVILGRMLSREQAEATATLPLDALALPPRARNALDRAGVITVEDVLHLLSDPGLSSIKGLGRKSGRAVEEAIRNLLDNAAEASPEDIREMADPRPALITVAHDGVPDLLRLAPPLIGKVIELSGDPRDWEILRRRYGLDGKEPSTLEDLGLFFGITRERIRQLLKRTLDRLVAALDGSSASREFRTPVAVVEEVRAWQDLLATQPYLLETTIISALERRYDRPVGVEDQRYLPLLLTLIGADHVSAASIGIRKLDARIWSVGDRLDRSHIEAVIKCLQDRLSDNAMSESLFNLTVAVNRAVSRHVPASEVEQMLALLPEVERVDDDEYRQKLVYLPSLSRKAERVLRTEGNPLHYREIARRINHAHVEIGDRAPIARHQGLTGQLSQNEAFEPIGRSGAWKLKEWTDIRSESIVELMREALIAKQEACTFEELASFVDGHRPDVPKGTIYTLVSMMDEVFLRVGEGKVELAAWGGKAAGGTTRRRPEVVHEKMKSALLGLCEEAEGGTLKLAEVVREVCGRAGLPESTVRAHLKRAPWATVAGGPGGRSVHLDVQELREDEGPQGRRAAPVTQKVEETVRSYLSVQGEGRARVSDVWKHVQQTTGVKRPTTYSILDKMTGLRKEQEGSVLFCYLEGFQEKRPLPLPGLVEVTDAELTRELRLVEQNLTVDQVDTGMFQLGRLFEAEVKDCVLEASKRGVLTISKRKLNSLSHMIDALVENGVVRKGHHLTLLREIRNERAHEHIRSMEDKKKLMIKAPFIVEMYMKYIIQLRKYRTDLQTGERSSLN